jgi:hypothetical protein
MNGQYLEGMAFKGNNLFEGAMSFNKVRFEILPNGDVKAVLSLGI